MTKRAQYSYIAILAAVAVVGGSILAYTWSSQVPDELLDAILWIEQENRYWRKQEKALLVLDKFDHKEVVGILDSDRCYSGDAADILVVKLFRSGKIDYKERVIDIANRKTGSTAAMARQAIQDSERQIRDSQSQRP